VAGCDLSIRAHMANERIREQAPGAGAQVMSDTLSCGGRATYGYVASNFTKIV